MINLLGEKEIDIYWLDNYLRLIQNNFDINKFYNNIFLNSNF